MAILGHRLLQKGIRTKAEGKEVGLERYTYNVTYQVQTDDPETPPKNLYAYFKANTALPYFGRKFRFNGTSDAGAVCSELNIDYIEKSEGLFLADAVYTPIEGSDPPDQRPSEDDDGKETDDPLKWRKEISITSSPVSLPVVDAVFHGFDPPNIANPFLRIGQRTPPVNSAIVPFDPPPEFDRSITIVRIADRIPEWNEEKMAPWRETVNSERFVMAFPLYNFFFVIEPYCGRIKHLGGTSQFDNNIQHWRAEIEVWVHPVGWRDQLADMGTVRRAAFGDPDGAGSIISSDSNVRHPGIPNHKEIVDIDGNPLMQPVLLDGNGQPMKLTDGQVTKKVWLKYQYYEERSWAGAPLITEVI